MKASVNWFKDFIDVPENLKDFCHQLTMTGSKVERLIPRGVGIQGVVTGKIQQIDPHPDADRLRICLIDIHSDETLQIVTGATNVQEGDVVPVALHGAVLAEGLKIKKGKLRGILSQGMLCSEDELGIGGDTPAAGVLVLPEDTAIGVSIQSVIPMADTVIEFEITSNRPDCFSIEGLAREAAITLKQHHGPHPIYLKKQGTQATKDVVNIHLEATDLCQRYVGRLVENVRIKPSPLWLQQRLLACGIRPINNLVDITNYCLLELGQPMHAFDLSQIKGQSIEIRRAKRGESITTLDHVSRTLKEDMLVIADAERPLLWQGLWVDKTAKLPIRRKRLFWKLRYLMQRAFV